MSETLDDFRGRARTWLAENMPLRSDRGDTATVSVGKWERVRELQAKLHQGGFAGLCYPREYGGQGLGFEYQAAFNDEASPYEMPVPVNFPTLTICGPTLLEVASEDIKRDLLPRMISGELLFCQFLSEPNGGSNLAGVLTRADRRGNGWVLSGSKIWSSGADAADYAMCLARTNWDVPKHRGLTMFVFPIHQEGVDVQPIEMVNGVKEFCQEFIDEVFVPDSAVVGEVDDGWSVVNRLLHQERLAVSGASPFMSGKNYSDDGPGPGEPQATLPELAGALGIADQDWVRDIIGSVETSHVVHRALVKYLHSEVVAGRLPEVGMTLGRLYHAEAFEAEFDAGLNLAGSIGVSRDAQDEVGHWSRNYLSRQSASLGGGSTEMARNIIAERLLGMPREPAPDKDLPFREVRQSR
ncbi:acyl-CoA dehydrogenase family protein [Rhodococcus sp. SORGH_AS_0301]|uniref:acyl-CoA dehydrogenase family protein n=1 Tax=Rhodococcus sp. SORGH_AS_0301 TaxID=3041780 RepID=UPI0027832004|nr:acyl-CoA dehydrogenase family protein [Rhodococcus sp. SORGH_AS_0301]MDQ1178577.1 alkylation response protein AidB-like acyl-CoA dehydrogenase [Rhodococcus sp. SORGH_AS_0301]